MGVAASLTLPVGDAVSSVETFVNVFIILYGIVLFAYILTSWVRLPYSLTLDRIQHFLHDVSEPYLRLFRRLLPMAATPSWRASPPPFTAGSAPPATSG